MPVLKKKHLDTFLYLTRLGNWDANKKLAKRFTYLEILLTSINDNEEWEEV